MAPDERYFSYLLRFRQERDEAPWRVVLEDAHSGERRAFPNAESAFAFLRVRLKAAAERPGEASPGPDLDQTPS